MFIARCNVIYSLAVRFRYSSTIPEAQQIARAFLKNCDTSTIPRETCEVTFSRSSGPGGQNVNKLNTKATLRLRQSRMDWIPTFLQDELRATSSQYLTKEGDLIIHSQRNRTQEANKEDCFRKLVAILVDAGSTAIQGETEPEQREKVGRMIKRDNEVRIKQKKMHSDKKSSRRNKGGDL